MKKYRITVGDQTRDLPLIPISDDIAIASFVLLGDDAMSKTAANCFCLSCLKSLIMS